MDTCARFVTKLTRLKLHFVVMHTVVTKIKIKEQYWKCLSGLEVVQPQKGSSENHQKWNKNKILEKFSALTFLVLMKT